MDRRLHGLRATKRKPVGPRLKAPLEAPIKVMYIRPSGFYLSVTPTALAEEVKGECSHREAFLFYSTGLDKTSL